MKMIERELLFELSTLGTQMSYLALTDNIKVEIHFGLATVEVERKANL